MKYITRIFLSLVSVLTCALCSAETNGRVLIAPADSNLVLVGRFKVSPDSAQYVYPGSTIRLRFRGDASVYAKLKPGAGVYNVYVDSLAPRKIDTYASADSLYLIAAGLTNAEHTISLMLISEGCFHNPAFYGFSLEEGAEVLKSEYKPLKIEFIGNSITCGYGVETQSQTDTFSFQTENFAKSFAGLTAAALDADAMVVARSGIGVYRNFGDKKEGSVSPLPSFYGKVHIFGQEEWNFASFTPSIVFVNLGTNDLSVGSYDLSLFRSAYCRFVDQLLRAYPQAHIVLLTGPMLHGRRLRHQKRVLNSIHKHFLSSGCTRVHRFDFAPQNGTLGYSADWHPSAAQHKVMARMLVEWGEKEWWGEW